MAKFTPKKDVDKKKKQQRHAQKPEQAPPLRAPPVLQGEEDNPADGASRFCKSPVTGTPQPQYHDQDHSEYHRPPLKSIALQQQQQQPQSSSSSTTPTLFNLQQCFSEEAVFDLMEIKVTLYGITGLLSRTPETTFKKPPFPRGLRFRSSKQAAAATTTAGTLITDTSPITKPVADKEARSVLNAMMSPKTPQSMGGNPTLTALTPKESPSRRQQQQNQQQDQNQQQEQQQPSASSSAVSSSSSAMSSSSSSSSSAAPFSPPTTAVVSYKRNILSSGTTMETFLPSCPLERQSRPEARTTVQYGASWPAQNAALGQVGVDTSTLAMVRVMKLQQFLGRTNNNTLIKPSTHVHETIELCIFVGRGKELIPLGVGSFVITGDEDGEVIHNIPVRAPKLGTSTFDQHFVEKTNRRRRRSLRKSAAKTKQSFSNNPREEFILDENATLQAGVRVLPQRIVLAASERETIESVKDEQAFQEVINKLLAESTSDMDKGLEAARQSTLSPKKAISPVAVTHRRQGDDCGSDESEGGTSEDDGHILDDDWRAQRLTFHETAANAETPHIPPLFHGFLCGLPLCTTPTEDEHMGADSKVGSSVSSLTKKTKSEEDSHPALLLPLSIVSSFSESFSTRDKKFFPHRSTY